MKKNWGYFLGLFVLILYLFKNAFSIKLFQDDYFFMQITNINSFSGFLNFFNPVRDYSYKPLPTEVFYFLFHKLGNNFFIAHSIVFLTYFTGLVYLYKIIEKVTKNEMWAKISTLLYGISFVHVFQLYWLATYQEILMFTFLAISFYKYLNNKIIQSLAFFILSLFCKETAILYVVFLVVWEVVHSPLVTTWLARSVSSHPSHKATEWQSRMTKLIPFIVFAIIFYLIYKYSLSSVTANPNYAMDFNNIRLLINNCIWYLLWGLGLPNFLYLYLPSLTSKPIPEFWNLLSNSDIRNYFISLIVYYFLSLIGLMILIIKGKRNEVSRVFIFSIIGFYIFLGPILFFMHKWMVRLTAPLIFISLFQGYLIVKLFELRINKLFISFILIFYLLFNYYGTLVHESSSLYTSESRIYKNMQTILNKNMTKISTYKIIYIKGILSERIKNNLHDQSYSQYFLNRKDIATYYENDLKIIPTNSLIIESTDLLK